MARKTVSDDFRVFSERLSDLMKERGLKQQDLADVLGIKRQTVSLYMTGQSMPNAAQLKNIAMFFDVSADWLLGITETRSQDIDIKYICKKIGLKENVVIKLQEIYEGQGYIPETIEGVNSILSNTMFHLLARDYVRLKRFTEKVDAEYKTKSFDELENPICEDGEVVTLKGCQACNYFRSKLIEQFGTMLDMDIPVYQTTAKYWSMVEDYLKNI